MKKSKAVAVGGVIFLLACTSPAMLAIHRGELAGSNAVVWWIAFACFGSVLIYDNFLVPAHRATPRFIAIVFAILVIFGFAMVLVSNDVVKYASSITLVLAAQRLPRFTSIRNSYLGAAAIELGLIVLLAFFEPWLAILGNGGAVAASLLFVVTFGAQEQREAAARMSLALANAELVATREQLAQSSRTEERLRIARDLHDTLGHHLTALSIQLDVASRRTTEEATQHIREAHAIARLLLSDVRAVVGELRSGGEVDVASLVRPLCRDYGDLKLHLTSTDGMRALPFAQAETILHCAQEGITNALKHANAKNLWIKLEQSDSGIALHIRDDGHGTHTIDMGHGLIGMRERFTAHGGRVEFASQARDGFTVNAFLPFAKEGA